MSGKIFVNENVQLTSIIFEMIFLNKDLDMETEHFKNKPAVQAAGADPSQCNCTTR